MRVSDDEPLTPAPPGAAVSGVDAASADESGAEVLHRRTVLRMGSVLAVLAISVFGGFYHATGVTVFAWLCLVFGGAIATVAALAWNRPAVDRWVQLQIGLCMALLTVQLVLQAGVANDTAKWMLCAPVAMMIGGWRRAAAAWGAWAVAVYAMVAGAAQVGALAPRVVVQASPLQTALDLTVFLVTLSLFTGLSMRSRERLAERLAQRHAQLAEALALARHAQRDAEAAARAKERFLANMTHEIRTPLAGIVGTAELLAAETPAAVDTPRHRELSDALLRSAAELRALTDAMLAHARLRAGQASVTPQPVALPGLLHALAAEWRALAERSNLTLVERLDPGLPAWAGTDGTAVRQILSNLLSNAIKFTPAGGQVVLIATPLNAQASPPIWRLAVRDSGPGVSPQAQARVFEPFFQADTSMTRRHGGTGLGLSIAAELARLLGGTMGVASPPGAGATFWLDLPLSACAAPVAGDPSAPPAGPGPAGVGRRVLLVEDNEVNQLVGAGLLAQAGCQVTVAADGAEAVRLLAGTRFDLVLMDLQMPVLDGLEAVRQVRAHEAATGRPRQRIVALTGNSEDDYGQAGREAGIDGFMIKPMRREALQRWLGPASAE